MVEGTIPFRPARWSRDKQSLEPALTVEEYHTRSVIATRQALDTLPPAPVHRDSKTLLSSLDFVGALVLCFTVFFGTVAFFAAFQADLPSHLAVSEHTAGFALDAHAPSRWTSDLTLSRWLERETCDLQSFGTPVCAPSESPVPLSPPAERPRVRSSPQPPAPNHASPAFPHPSKEVFSPEPAAPSPAVFEPLTTPSVEAPPPQAQPSLPAPPAAAPASSSPEPARPPEPPAPPSPSNAEDPQPPVLQALQRAAEHDVQPVTPAPRQASLEDGSAAFIAQLLDPTDMAALRATVFNCLSVFLWAATAGGCAGMVLVVWRSALTTWGSSARTAAPTPKTPRLPESQMAMKFLELQKRVTEVEQLLTERTSNLAAQRQLFGDMQEEMSKTTAELNEATQMVKNLQRDNERLRARIKVMPDDAARTPAAMRAFSGSDDSRDSSTDLNVSERDESEALSTDGHSPPEPARQP